MNGERLIDLYLNSKVEPEHDSKFKRQLYKGVPSKKDRIHHLMNLDLDHNIDKDDTWLRSVTMIPRQ